MSHDGSVRQPGFQAFRAPSRLEVTPLTIDRVLLIGQCLLHHWIAPIETMASPATTVDFVLFNNLVELPDQPAHPVADYTFQVVSLPLRIMLPETLYLGLAYSDVMGAETLFAGACDRLDVVLDAALKWNRTHGLLTFVANFLLPQQNPDGRLLPRYDLRNLIHVVERLNQHLVGRVASYRNAHMLDIDAIAASFGRRHVQDDGLWIHSHGSTLDDHDVHYDTRRLEAPPQPPSIEFKLNTGAYIGEVWRELVGLMRTIRQVDPVKMVIIDLDDTLWRGVLAERELLDTIEVEGWPLGVVEALMFLKRRGVLLAIASKNEESAVGRIFEDLYAHRIHLSDFAIKRITWRPKTETIAEILVEANLLPRNVVFIDDNPVERDAVAAAFPEMRILGASLYSIRRDLLWSAETQVASITNESERRGEMIQAQGAREQARTTLSRADFLASLGIVLTVFEVIDQDANFPRAFELLNKTNQFNTTGRRWRDDELAAGLHDGMRIVAFTAKDRFVDYGLVGVLLLEPESIRQFVMSCRVFGLGVERAVVRIVVDHLEKRGARTVVASFVETPTNFPCRDLYPGCGFETCVDGWVATPSRVIIAPEHIEAIVRLQTEEADA